MRKFLFSSIRRLLSSVFILSLALLGGTASEPFHLPFGKWSRVSEEPVIAPKGEGF